MPDHEVRFSAKNIHVRQLDFDFDVKVDGEVLGTLSVSEGGLAWRPKHGSKSSKGKINIPWTDFSYYAAQWKPSNR